MDCVNNLTNTIYKVKSDLATDSKLNIECVGKNTDIYLNLFPIIFDIDVITSQNDSIINQFAKSSSCKDALAIFIDESSDHLQSICEKPQFIIKRDKCNFTLSQNMDFKPQFIINFLENENIYFF